MLNHRLGRSAVLERFRQQRVIHEVDGANIGIGLEPLPRERVDHGLVVPANRVNHDERTHKGES